MDESPDDTSYKTPYFADWNFSYTNTQALELTRLNDLWSSIFIFIFIRQEVRLSSDQKKLSSLFLYYSCGSALLACLFIAGVKSECLSPTYRSLSWSRKAIDPAASCQTSRPSPQWNECRWDWVNWRRCNSTALDRHGIRMALASVEVDKQITRRWEMLFDLSSHPFPTFSFHSVQSILTPTFEFGVRWTAHPHTTKACEENKVGRRHSFAALGNGSRVWSVGNGKGKDGKPVSWPGSFFLFSVVFWIILWKYSPSLEEEKKRLKALFIHHTIFEDLYILWKEVSMSKIKELGNFI